MSGILYLGEELLVANGLVLVQGQADVINSDLIQFWFSFGDSSDDAGRAPAPILAGAATTHCTQEMCHTARCESITRPKTPTYPPERSLARS